MLTRKVILPLPALLLAALLLPGCGGGAKHADPSADAALLSSRDLATAARTDLATGVPVQGTLQPAVDVTIVAPYPELIDAVVVKEGQAARRGQVLARMRSSSIAPAAASAESQRRVAAADFDRMKNLFKEGAVAQRDVDGAEAALRAAEANAALAHKRLDDATVTAPFDGVVAKRFVQGGDRVGDGDPLFRFVNTGELEFAASVPTEALGGVRVGAAVSLQVSGLEDVRIAGRVARINATVDPSTRQVKVYVNVPNPDHRLAGDMFASGRIVVDGVKGVVAVPAAAVRHDPDGTAYAWVVAGDKVERRAFAAGIRDERRDLVEVRGGVRDGESVIVSPVEGLTSGQAVRVAGDPADSAKAAAPAAARAGR